MLAFFSLPTIAFYSISPYIVLGAKWCPATPNPRSNRAVLHETGNFLLKIICPGSDNGIEGFVFNQSFWILLGPEVDRGLFRWQI
jgi:hypothetical protein